MANIVCCRCGAMPYPPPGSKVREDFDLLKLTPDGKPAGEGEGDWYCSRRHQRGPGACRIVLEEDEAS